MDNEQPGPSTGGPGQQPGLSRAEKIARLQENLRRLSGQNVRTSSFPENPVRDDSNPDHFDDINRDRIGHTKWCRCQKCVPMITGIESLCCKELGNAEELLENIDCITCHHYFPYICENEDLANIFLFMSGGNSAINPANKDRHRSLRKATYRAFTGWVHGYLGKGERRPIPSCVVKKIREALPDPDGEYAGFRPFGDTVAEFMALD